MKWWWVVVLVPFLLCGSGFAKDSRRTEQVHFSAEDSAVQHPVEIPESVLAILRTERTVRDVLESENLTPDKLPRSWFSGSAIHLSNSSKPDLIVAAEPPMMGTNVQTFWVFRAVGSGYQLVMTALVHDLMVKDTRHNGYRDIELLSATAVTMSTVVCRFDGKRYVKYRGNTEPIH